MRAVAAACPALGVLHLLTHLFCGVHVGIAPCLAFAFPQWSMSLMLYGIDMVIDLFFWDVVFCLLVSSNV